MSASAGTKSAGAANPPKRLRLALVGDVHYQWGSEDAAALAFLAPDCTLVVGDFGEEAVDLVARVARECPEPRAVILGNHDAWFSLTASGRQRYARSMGAALAGGGSNRVRQQLDALGAAHVGYGARQWPELGLSVVGARPFSKGGGDWTAVAAFYSETYGVKDMQHSAARVAGAIEAQPSDHAVVVLGHNGPAGLGAAHHAICGADFKPDAGDHGDADLQAALAAAAAAGRPVPLVVFGHMHEQLKHGGAPGRMRDMVAVDPATGTVYVNAAVVPRVTEEALAPPSPSGAAAADGGGGKRRRGTLRHFCVVDVEGQVVVRAAHVWVAVPSGDAPPAASASAQAASAPGSNGGGGALAGRECWIAREQVVLKEAMADVPGTVVRTVLQGHSGRWVEVASPAPGGSGAAVPGGSDGHVDAATCATLT